MKRIVRSCRFSTSYITENQQITLHLKTANSCHQQEEQKYKSLFHHYIVSLNYAFVKYKNFYNNILFKGVHVERQVVKFAFEVGNRIQSEALRDEQGKMLTLCLADKVLDALEGEDELKLTAIETAKDELMDINR